MSSTTLGEDFVALRGLCQLPGARKTSLSVLIYALSQCISSAQPSILSMLAIMFWVDRHSLKCQYITGIKPEISEQIKDCNFLTTYVVIDSKIFLTLFRCFA